VQGVEFPLLVSEMSPPFFRGLDTAGQERLLYGGSVVQRLVEHRVVLRVPGPRGRAEIHGHCFRPCDAEPSSLATLSWDGAVLVLVAHDVAEPFCLPLRRLVRGQAIGEQVRIL